MATEVNQQSIGKPQPNYTLSKDDVDDVVVRPMATMQMRAEQPFVDQKPQHQQPLQPQAAPMAPPSKPTESRIPASVLQNSGNIDVISARQSAQASKLPEPQVRASAPTKPAEAKKASPVEPTKQNGTSKAHVSMTRLGNVQMLRLVLSMNILHADMFDFQEKVNEETSGTRATSRASSHKSQDNLNQRSSSLSRAKLLEKPAEPPKKGEMNNITPACCDDET